MGRLLRECKNTIYDKVNEASGESAIANLKWENERLKAKVEQSEQTIIQLQDYSNMLKRDIEKLLDFQVKIDHTLLDYKNRTQTEFNQKFKTKGSNQ
jgi:hypothetical protein